VVEVDMDKNTCNNEEVKEAHNNGVVVVIWGMYGTFLDAEGNIMATWKANPSPDSIRDLYD
jgi:hypothetical protein